MFNLYGKVALITGAARGELRMIRCVRFGPHCAVAVFCDMKIGLRQTLLYTSRQMSMKIPLLGAFLINTLFEHICMMPIAHAEHGLQPCQNAQ